MNTTTQPHLDSSESARIADALSTEPAQRSVELAVLRRITDAAKSAGTAILGKPVKADDDSVSANLARMQSPVFKLVARALEKTVPETKGFGRFRDHN